MYSAYSVLSPVKKPDCTSPGEVLWYALRDWFIGTQSDGVRSELFAQSMWADPKGRLGQFLEGAVVSSVCFRLIKESRRSLKAVMSSDSGQEAPFFRQEVVDHVKQFCVDPLGMSFSDRTISVFSELAFDCAIVARQEVSPRTRTIVLKEAARQGKGEVKCYCCCVVLGSWDMARNTEDIPLDHLWPSSFGGISSDENLLPICSPCNGLKMDRISWDVYGVVQDYALASHSSLGSSLTIMALHRKAAGKLAEAETVTLKEAFVRIGGSTALELIHPDDTDWFFNKTAHDAAALSEIW